MDAGKPASSSSSNPRSFLVANQNSPGNSSSMGDASGRSGSSGLIAESRTTGSTSPTSPTSSSRRPQPAMVSQQQLQPMVDRRLQPQQHQSAEMQELIALQVHLESKLQHAQDPQELAEAQRLLHEIPMWIHAMKQTPSNPDRNLTRSASEQQV